MLVILLWILHHFMRIRERQRLKMVSFLFRRWSKILWNWWTVPNTLINCLLHYSHFNQIKHPIKIFLCFLHFYSFFLFCFVISIENLFTYENVTCITNFFSALVFMSLCFDVLASLIPDIQLLNNSFAHSICASSTMLHRVVFWRREKKKFRGP